MTAAGVLNRISRLRVKCTPEIRILRKQISKELLVENRGAVLALAFDLVEISPGARWVAYELVENHPASRDKITAKEVERLGSNLSSWSDVDSFAYSISGPAWREGRISDTLIHRWAKSEDRWRRRTALVSTVTLNIRARGGTGDTPRTLAVCELLIADRDDMVVKALSWALRALSKSDRAAVVGFVDKFGDELAPLVKREVRNKLATGLKNP